MKQQNILIILLIICFTFNATAQVGINTVNPKAVLDIEASNLATPANTDGLLVPRINSFPATNPTVDQNGILVYLTTIDGVNLPGLYFWNNSTTTWIGKGVHTETNNHYIGEFFGGGIIFHLFEDGQHGLIGSLHELDGGNGVVWNDDILTGAHSFFDGKSNTALIVAVDPTPNRPATLCDSYTGGGYTDWYLPAPNEFFLLYKTAYITTPILLADGDPNTIPFFYVVQNHFYSNSLWSSAEFSSTQAIWFDVGDTDYMQQGDKSTTIYVRAIRSF